MIKRKTTNEKFSHESKQPIKKELKSPPKKTEDKKPETKKAPTKEQQKKK